MRRLFAIVAFVLALGVAQPASAATGLASVNPGVTGSIERLYRAVFLRPSDHGGLQFHTNRYVSGRPLHGIASDFIGSEEYRLRYPAHLSDEQFVELLYHNVLGRASDPGGKGFWLAHLRSGRLDRAGVLVGFSESPEFVARTGTPRPVAPPKPDPCRGRERGWSDSGNGVCLPAVLLKIRWCESRNNYRAANPTSSARGAFQFLRSSWANYGHARTYGVSQAHHATPAQQDMAALNTWRRSGTRPWNASRRCWA